MSETRVTTYAIGGLITTPGKQAYPSGACSSLKNFRFIGKNRLQGMRRYTVASTGGSSGAFPFQTLELDNNKYAVMQTTGASTLCYGSNTSSFLYTVPSYVTSSAPYATDGFMQPMKTRKRLFINTTVGEFVSDYTDPDFSVAAQHSFRAAGLPQLQICSVSSSAGSAIPSAIMCSYACVARRETQDYTLRSEPSVTQLKWNDQGNSVDYTMRIAWGYSDDIIEGDFIELYRSIGVIADGYSPIFDTGTQCFLVARSKVSSTNATNKFIDITDTQMMGVAPDYSTSGITIYTDSTQEGASFADLPPPNAKVQCVWKGMSFFGNITEAPIATLEPKAVVGLLTSSWEKTNGVGIRLGVCTITSGSSVVPVSSPTDLVGIKVGQVWVGRATLFPTGSTVISVAGGNITFNHNALDSDTSFSIADSVSIDGHTYRFGWWGDLVQNIGTAGLLRVVTSETVASTGFAVEHQVGVSAGVQPIHFKPSMTVSVTNAQNYSGGLTETASGSATLTTSRFANLVRGSKTNLPEAVPTGLNPIPCGFGEVVALAPTTDFLYAFCTDGAYVITGVEGNFICDFVSSNMLISGPQAYAVMNEKAFIVGNRGLVSLTAGNTISTISNSTFEELVPSRAYQASATPWLTADADREELWILYRDASFAAASTMYIWNEHFKALSQYELSGSDAYVKTLNINSGDANTLPAVTFSIYNSVSTQPKYATLAPGFGTTLSLQVFLRELGDRTINGQWQDATWFFDLSSFTETVASLFNFVDAPVGAADTKSNEIDCAATLGVPKRSAILPTICPGFNITAPNHTVEVLGVSLRTNPQTIQQKYK